MFPFVLGKRFPSASRCGPDSPRPKKTTRSFGGLKASLVIFYDEGIFYDHPVHPGQTVNGEVYSNMVRKVPRAIRGKVPNFKNEVGPILLLDNVAPNRCKMVQEAACSSFACTCMFTQK